MASKLEAIVTRLNESSDNKPLTYIQNARRDLSDLVFVVARVEALATKLENIVVYPGGYTPESAGYAEGEAAAYERVADEIRTALAPLTRDPNKN